MPGGYESAVATIVSTAARNEPEIRLRQLLDESANIYRGLSSSQAEWLRAQVYAALAQSQCSPETTGAAMEDLRTSHNPIVLAGAARCLAAQETLDPCWAQIAQTARRRIALCDVYPDIRIPSAHSCCGKSKTALGEIDALIDRFSEPGVEVGSEMVEVGVPETFPLCPELTSAIEFRDQEGNRMTFSELVFERPASIAFFYTRCMNPQKCSLTISRLGETARKLSAYRARVGCFGISYDPRFDTSPRLAAYGQDRGFPFSPNDRLLRCTSGWPSLRRLFGLRVGFGASVVNGHSRELFVVYEGKRAERFFPDALNNAAGLLKRLGDASTAQKATKAY